MNTRQLIKILLMLSQDKITQIFCSIDDFCKDYVPNRESQLLSMAKNALQNLT